HAARVVVTLPLGVLQVAPDAPGSVRFVPEIAATRRAAGELASGAVMKVVVRVSEPFWERADVARSAGADEGVEDLSFVHVPGAAFATWWTARPLRVPVITGWVGGPAAAMLSGSSREEIEGAAVESLAMAFGVGRKRAASWVERVHAHDWPADPFSR